MVTADTMAAAIRENVADMVAERITHEEFHRRAIALWDVVVAAGKRTEVSRILFGVTT